jgi:hypothetical protein
MLKKIQFKLKKIKYSGKSIGDDIRVNIEILDKTLQVDKRIKVGSTVESDKEIGSFPTDQKSFFAKVKIVITEKDTLFNDVNTIEKTIKVDTENTKPQNFVYIVELRENRFWKNWGTSVAEFKITIEAASLETTRYISDVSNGWLKVKTVDNEEVSLPAFLKVRLEHIERGREYFTILEGLYIGQTASVKLNENGSSLLSINVQHEPMPRIKYSIARKKLYISGKGYAAADDQNFPWQRGWYDIELPDYPHKDRGDYTKIATRAKTWFRIGHEGKRYLHTGRFSLGCITITEVEKWDEIYGKLIKARKGDFASVGVLEVVD